VNWVSSLDQKTTVGNRGHSRKLPIELDLINPLGEGILPFNQSAFCVRLLSVKTARAYSFALLSKTGLLNSYRKQRRRYSAVKICQNQSKKS
jgi:hypothetical protein